MEEALKLWSPVVLGELASQQEIQAPKVYHLEESYQNLDDLKIRVREKRMSRRGQIVEVFFKVEVLALLEDAEGNMRLLKREEELRDHLPIEAFEIEYEMEKETDMEFALWLGHSKIEGSLEGSELKVEVYVFYNAIAMRRQIVNLPEMQAEVKIPAEVLEDIYDLREQIARIGGENLELRRKVRFYEQNLSSLKKGMKKAERRNAKLYQEGQEYQQRLNELRRVVQEKPLGLPEENTPRLLPENTGFRNDSSLGSRVKRLFANNS